MGEDAIYFDVGNADALARRLEWALEHKAELDLMGRRARRRVVEAYSGEKIAARYAEIYFELAEK